MPDRTLNPLLEHPAPDFDTFARVLSGEQAPKRVHLVEPFYDIEVLQAIAQRYSDEPWIPLTPDTKEAFIRQLVNLFYRLGYDCAPVFMMWRDHPAPRKRRAADTAALSHGERVWVEESRGLINSWEEFEAFPWDTVKASTETIFIVAKCLPEGMKIAAINSIYEHVMEELLGYEGLFYLLYDEPELVAQVFDRWGQIIYDGYAEVIGMDEVGAIFHGDDLGFKTSTLLAPDDLRRLVFPWFKKIADLAHAHGKPCWLHSCGNLYAQGVIEDLIEYVGIDGLHSFQDVILPVGAFYARYGSRVAALGGVDVDALARMDEPSLRAYVRRILDQCMPGRFALGSGNSLTNYINVDNYIAMLDEGRRWQAG